MCVNTAHNNAFQQTHSRAAFSLVFIIGGRHWAAELVRYAEPMSFS